MKFFEDDAAIAAAAILRGEAKDVDRVLALVKKNPALLHTVNEAKDQLGRRVRGTLLQIAVMSGDIDVNQHIEDENLRGVAEQLIRTGLLSKEEIAEQLKCVTSDEAKKINEERKQRILSAVTRFGEAVISITRAKNSKFDYTVILENYRQNLNACETDRNLKDRYQEAFKDYKKEFEPLIEQFKKDLQLDPNEVISTGYMFDISTLRDAIAWLKENEYRYKNNNVQSNILCVYIIGTLQKMLSTRDVQVIKYPNYLSNIPGRPDVDEFYNNASIGLYHFLYAYEKTGSYMHMNAVSLPHRFGNDATADALVNYYSTLTSRRDHSLDKILGRENPLVINEAVKQLKCCVVS